MRWIVFVQLILVCGCGKTNEQKFLDSVVAVRAGKRNFIDQRKAPMVDESQLSELAGLTGLVSLNLDNTPITDQGLQTIGPNASLKKLSLTKTLITSKAVPLIVEQFPNLQFLRLDETATTDAAVTETMQLQKLKELSLYKTRVGDTGCESLAQISGLEKISLDKTAVTDKGLRILLQNESIKSISVWGTRVTKEGVKAAMPENRNVRVNL